MGLLVSSLWRRLFTYKEFKICLVGLDNAGKTTILFQLHMGEVVETQPTIGCNVEEVIHKNVHFNVWDLGGQESTRSGWSTYFLGTHAVIIVVDSTDRQRIGQVKAELWKLLASQELTNAVLLILANKADLVKQIPESDHMNGKSYAQPSSSSSSTPPPSASSTSGVISSSSSPSVNTLPSPSPSHSLSHPRPNPCMTPADIAEELNLQSIKTHSWHIQSCCALTGEGLYEGIDWVTQAVTQT